jgi:hypothetical protein
LTSIFLATSKQVQGKTGGYYFQCVPVTTIYTAEAAKGLDYIGQSKMRTEISLSDQEAQQFWTVASKNVGLED